MPLDTVELRREFHRYPEIAFQEIRTAARIAEILTGLGLVPKAGAGVMNIDTVVDYPAAADLDSAATQALATGANEEWVGRLRQAGTAVIVDIEGLRPGPLWTLRFDIDALPIAEATDPEHAPARGSFVSEFGGRMHACGHDGHVAVGLSLAERLSADRDFSGCVRLIFQPAEEGGRGASSLLSAGVTANVDRFVAIHLGLGRPLRHVVGGARGGFATTKLRASYRGRPSHASTAPEEGRNALAAAAAATLAVLSQPRWSSADTRVNVGTLCGGDGVNIIPGWAEIAAETRSMDAEVESDLTARVIAALDGAARTFGCAVDVVRTGGSTTIASDPELAAEVSAVAKLLGGTSDVFEAMPGSDDASLFMADVQRSGGDATYIIVGAGNAAAHHSSSFDIDEASLEFSVDLLDGLVRGRGIRGGGPA